MPTKNIKDMQKSDLNEDLIKVHEILFDNANDIILYLLEDGRILSANKMAIEKYGYTYDELTTMYIQDLRHPSMDSSYIDQMTLSEYSGIVFEGIHVRKDGSTFPVEVSSKTIILHGDKFRIHIIRDITDRKKIESKILRLATYDPLTNIPNRANIIAQLDTSIKKARLTGNNIALMLLDMDKFKNINDTFGHLIGDKVLQYIAITIKNLLRSTDTIGRFGGDEFIIIQQNINSKNDVIALINRIFNIFKFPTVIEGNNININMSIGVCLLSESENRDQLIYQADTAMYEAKKSQGCSFEFYNDVKSKE